MINIESMVKSYQTEDIETVALDNIDLTVEQGEFLAIMGPSGCGKSTLLNILGLLDNPTSGIYNFFGQDVTNMKEKELSVIRKHNVGFIFQEFNLIGELTVFENVELALLYHGFSVKERKERVLDILKKVSIDHRVNHYPKKLSGGQQQRVAIARALVSNPKLVVADEPTGNLDSKLGREVMELLQDLNRRGTTLIMVTHSEEHSGYATRTVSLLDGKIVEHASCEMNTKEAC
ncbi:ABC transporter ATP-binding protein [Pseudoalteromonas sp. MMG013]|uniref:ABC transporter ATP-binding protein n=1 Tax=Pseudoalteromonas sp. MMG013 TaxID=2822687 RepID=UPI001B36926A|nr:ABC transporter ATP-binding protein [Pseudoalteromonas sp. MMG013]MBQ4862194.1 ABC transporter ATP-binding protein [Pseudoalteromonas sp. MMG013]